MVNFQQYENGLQDAMGLYQIWVHLRRDGQVRVRIRSKCQRCGTELKPKDYIDIPNDITKALAGVCL